MTFRGFISADFGSNPSLGAFLEALRAAGDGLKVVSPDQLHVTLKFLGEAEAGLVPQITEIMRTASAGIEPIRMQVRGTGAFPNLSRIKVIWVGLEGAEPLASIATRLDSLLESLGFHRESRPWMPHMTVARVRSARGFDRVRRILETHKDELFAEVEISEIRLKKSVLTPSGPIYSDVGRVPLKNEVG